MFYYVQIATELDMQVLKDWDYEMPDELQVVVVKSTVIRGSHAMSEQGKTKRGHATLNFLISFF